MNVRRLDRILVSAVAVIALGAGVSALGCARNVPKAGTGVTTMRIGTLPTEDALPLYVAAQAGSAGGSSPAASGTAATAGSIASKAGIDLQMITFPSARERDAALAAGKIDGFMGDVLAAAALSDKGTPVKIATIMLGADPSEGRFGIVVPKNSPITNVAQLRQVPIATSFNTITEYVIDKLLLAQGFDPAEIKKEDVSQIPVRMQLLLSGKIRAAALPDPLLAFAQSQGARLIIDDTQGHNISQTVLVFNAAFLSQHEAAVKAFLGVDAAAVKAIDADPQRFRQILVREAKLPAPIAASYKLNIYPAPQLPSAADVQPLLDWARAKQLIGPSVTVPKLLATDLYETTSP
jgi:NitT/TauT family transport system substrate-binding protein